MNTENGFTLIELLVTVAIVGILASLAMPMYHEFRVKAYDSSMQQEIKSLAKMFYAIGHGESDNGNIFSAPYYGTSSGASFIDTLIAPSGDKQAFQDLGALIDKIEEDSALAVILYVRDADASHSSGVHLSYTVWGKNCKGNKIYIAHYSNNGDSANFGGGILIDSSSEAVSELPSSFAGLFTAHCSSL